MRLLVSVRAGAEVASAVEGGADIVDAKEPARGSLGAVDAAVLAAVGAALPEGVPLSVALGDARDAGEADSLVAGFGQPRARYLKLGFAGAEDERAVREVLAAAVARAGSLPGRPGIIAVAYADHRNARSLPPAAIVGLAAEAGAAGVLLDTHGKEGGGLFAWISPGVLAAWVGAGREAGLLTAVAGSLTASTIPLAVQAAPDVVGVRGAACRGGRSGIVSAAKVRGLREALLRGAGAYFGLYSGDERANEELAAN